MDFVLGKWIDVPVGAVVRRRVEGGDLWQITDMRIGAWVGDSPSHLMIEVRALGNVTLTDSWFQAADAPVEVLTPSREEIMAWIAQYLGPTDVIEFTRSPS